MGEYFKRWCVPPDVSTVDACADGDGAEDVQAEWVCLPQYERGSSEEQTDVHDAGTFVCGGGNQEPLPPEEVIKKIQEKKTSYCLRLTVFRVLMCVSLHI